MKRKWAERIKTALIVLLAASAVLLGWRTKLFNELLKSMPFFGSVAGLVKSATGDETGSFSAKEAARPLVIVITGEDGSRYGVKYDTETRNAVYDKTSGIIGEALGSASGISVIGEEEWRKALRGPGVFFGYASPVKLSVLDYWLGMKMPREEDDSAIRNVFVAFGEDKNKLYYMDVETGLFYGADTASSSDMGNDPEYGPNAASFAFESVFAEVGKTPYFMITPQSIRKTVSASISGTQEEILLATLEAFGRGNEAYTTSVIGSTGVLSCIGAQFSVAIWPDGAAVYRITEKQDGAPPAGESGMIERARRIVADSIGGTSGDAEVFFETMESNADDSCTVSFGYYIAGGRIYLPEDGPAARITFADGAVSEAELVFRTYSTAEEYMGMLPEIQALAAAGCEIALCYSDNGQETMLPFWLPMESRMQGETR